MLSFMLWLTAATLIAVAVLNIVRPRSRCPRCNAFRGWLTGWMHTSLSCRLRKEE